MSCATKAFGSQNCLQKLLCCLVVYENSCCLKSITKSHKSPCHFETTLGFVCEKQKKRQGSCHLLAQLQSIITLVFITFYHLFQRGTKFMPPRIQVDLITYHVLLNLVEMFPLSLVSFSMSDLYAKALDEHIMQKKVSTQLRFVPSRYKRNQGPSEP